MNSDEFRAQRVVSFTYPGGLTIERIDGEYVLTIGNEITRSNDLPYLEGKLYQWATDEGYWDDADAAPSVLQGTSDEA